MGLVHFLDPIDYISGKISKKFRTIYLRRVESDRRYTQVRNPRTTPPSADEIEMRSRFASIATAVAARMKNLSTITTDQAAFYAQKENGIPTFKAYIWSLEKARYDEQHG